MKYLPLILLSFLSLSVHAQYDSTKNLQSIEAYGYSWKNAAFRYSIRLPKDTPKLAVKDSGCLAVKGSTLYLWNGIRWVGNTSSGGSGIYIDSLTRSVSGCRVIYTTWKNGTGTNIDTAYRRDGIVTGGLILNRLNDSTFRISAAQYLIGCSNYNSPLDTITLAGSTGSALSRFYTIGFDNTNNVFFSAGTPSASPSIPQVDEATQIGKYTVFFPAGSDSGITNIYTTVNYSGVDSGAIYSFTQLDSFNVLACRRNGICDTIRSIYTAGGGSGIDSIRRIGVNVSARKGGVWINQFTDSIGTGGGGIDSLRRIGLNVSALKNGVWVNQFTDSVGTAGGSQNLDQVLAVGNNTDTTMNFVDTLSTSDTKNFVTIYPRGYGQTGYPNGRPSMFNAFGYGRYPGVNADGRPNVVGLLWGYNGGFNNPILANEPTWGVRTETWFQIAGAGVSEFHGVMPEFKSINGISRRLATAYVNNANGYTNYNLQIDNMNILRGASDTVQLASSINRLFVGVKGVGDISLQNQDSTTSSTQIILGLNGTSFNNNVSTGAQPNNNFTFNSVVSVTPGTSYGSSATYAGIVNSNVAIAGKYGYVIAQTGLASSGFGGLGAPSINTSGQFDLIYGRNSGTGTIRAHLQTNTSGTASYVLSDQSSGLGWLISFRGGTTERSLSFNSSSYDSAFSIRGQDGKAKFRNSLNVGDGTYPVTSAALQVTSTTQGLLLPRMTKTQRDAISTPVAGLAIYQTDNTPGLRVYNGTNWMRFTETTD
jgi:hypothetical protein